MSSMPHWWGLKRRLIFLWTVVWQTLCARNCRGVSLLNTKLAGTIRNDPSSVSSFLEILKGSYKVSLKKGFSALAQSVVSCFMRTFFFSNAQGNTLNRTREEWRKVFNRTPKNLGLSNGQERYNIFFPPARGFSTLNLTHEHYYQRHYLN